MKFRLEDGMVLFASFILNGTLTFPLFLLSGIIYHTGSSLEVVILIGTVTTGGLVFALAGLAAARSDRKVWIALLPVSLAGAVYPFLAIHGNNVLGIVSYSGLSLLELAPVMAVSYLCSRFIKALRGRAFSVGHFISIGAGSPVIFAALFFAYVFMSYSGLPLIALLAEAAGLAIAGAVLRFSAIKYFTGMEAA